MRLNKNRAYCSWSLLQSQLTSDQMLLPSNGCTVAYTLSHSQLAAFSNIQCNTTLGIFCDHLSRDAKDWHESQLPFSPWELRKGAELTSGFQAVRVVVAIQEESSLKNSWVQKRLPLLCDSTYTTLLKHCMLKEMFGPKGHQLSIHLWMHRCVRLHSALSSQCVVSNFH